MGTSLRQLALKPGELKALSREDLLLFCARLAMRMEGWRPKGSDGAFERGLGVMVSAALGEPPSPAALKKLYVSLSNLGADAANDTDGTPEEVFGRCRNYAMETLCAGVDAVGASDAAALKGRVIDAAKLAGSIPAVLAHGGKISTKPPKGKDVVDLVCTQIWSIIRDDLKVVQGAAEKLAKAKDPLVALRKRAPLWPKPAPGWSASPRG